MVLFFFPFFFLFALDFCNVRLIRFGFGCAWAWVYVWGHVVYGLCERLQGALHVITLEEIGANSIVFKKRHGKLWLWFGQTTKGTK